MERHVVVTAKGYRFRQARGLQSNQTPGPPREQGYRCTAASKTLREIRIPPEVTGGQNYHWGINETMGVRAKSMKISAPRLHKQPSTAVNEDQIRLVRVVHTTEVQLAHDALGSQ